jgi:hypothetical protein
MRTLILALTIVTVLTSSIALAQWGPPKPKCEYVCDMYGKCRPVCR